MPQIKRTKGDGWNKLEFALKNIKGKVGKVGFVKNEKYDDTGTPVAYVAAIQEFGSPEKKIPPRSFMRTTVVKEKKNWAAIATNESKKIFKGTATLENVWQAVGVHAAGDIRQTITEIYTPPLSKVTLLLRKWKKQGKKISGLSVIQAAANLNSAHPESVNGVPTKPLVDTGTLLASCTNVVENE